jgi:hypothetical protein
VVGKPLGRTLAKNADAGSPNFFLNTPYCFFIHTQWLSTTFCHLTSTASSPPHATTR